MIHKTFVEVHAKLVARVTFSLPDSIWADRIMLVGDFNDWNTRTHPFSRTRAGTWFVTVDLEPRRAYQFRYLQGEDQWLNDPSADAHVHNIYGSDNSVIITDPAYTRYVDVRKSSPEAHPPRQSTRPPEPPTATQQPLSQQAKSLPSPSAQP